MKNKPLQALIVDDSEDDVLLVIRELIRGGYHPAYERVSTAAAMKEALKAKQWDIILCDYKMPDFSAPSALALLKKSNIDIPVIIISGVITEETAVECLRSGARNYVMKGNLSHLCPAIDRALEEVKVRNMKKHAEEALQKSERLFKEITENSSDIIMITDKNGDIKYCSQSVKRVSGYKPEEIIGRSAFTFMHPDDIERIFGDYCRAILADDNIPIHSRFRVFHKNGSVIYFEGLGKNLLNYPDITGFVMNFRDVTGRIRAAEKLQREREQFRALADMSPDIILLADREGTILHENPTLENIMGFKVADRIGRNVFENLHPDDLNLMMEAFNRLMSNQDSPSQKYEIRIRDIDGSWHTFEVVASNLKQGNVVDALLINLHDITERKKYEQERDLLVSELQTALSEIKQLSGLLPICSSCKKIRNDNGYWEQIESYIRDHSQAEFSHGICPDCANKIAANEHEQSSAGNVMGKVVILFVDDEKDFRVLFIRQLKRIVRDNEFEFIEARDAEMALKLLKEGAKPSMIILDYSLPDINGIELLRRIDADHPGMRDVPRIMLSGYNHEQLKKEVQALRCAFLEKGIDIEKLCLEIYRQMAISFGFSHT